MTPEEFIKALKIVVHDTSIKDVVETLEDPPGRRPPEKIKDLSHWFTALSEDDQSKVIEVIRQSVHAALFSSLCVLDGVRAIEPAGEKGVLKLQYCKGDNKTTLNDQNSQDLHDLYQAMTWEEVYK